MKKNVGYPKAGEERGTWRSRSSLCLRRSDVFSAVNSNLSLKLGNSACIYWYLFVE